MNRNQQRLKVATNYTTWYWCTYQFLIVLLPSLSSLLIVHHYLPNLLLLFSSSMPHCSSSVYSWLDMYSIDHYHIAAIYRIYQAWEWSSVFLFSFWFTQTRISLLISIWSRYSKQTVCYLAYSMQLASVVGRVFNFLSDVHPSDKSKKSAWHRG